MAVSPPLAAANQTLSLKHLLMPDLSRQEPFKQCHANGRFEEVCSIRSISHPISVR